MNPLKLLEDELRTALGTRYVTTDPDIMRTNEVDWTGRFVGSASMVVAPADTREVALTVRAAAAHGVAVVTQGGNTGLVGAVFHAMVNWCYPRADSRPSSPST